LKIKLLGLLAMLLTDYTGPCAQMTKAGSTSELFSEATPSGAWTFFTDPRSIQYQGKFDKTYLGFLDSAGSDRIWSLNHANGKIDTFTLHVRLQKDDHDNPALYMRKDGRLTVWYQRHGTDKYFLTRTTLEPEDITAWDKEDTIPMPAGTTYGHPFRLDADSGKLYLFNRSVGFHPTMMSSKDEGKTWNTPVKMIGGPGLRPYVKYVSDGDSSIHIAFTDGHPRNEATNSIYYMRYCKGAFYHANGTLIKTIANLPIEPNEADKVYDGATDGRAWIWDIALDAKNRPVLVHSVCPAETDHRYYYAYWNGSVWKDSLMTKAGGWFPQTVAGTIEAEPHYSGGIILDPVDPSIVYLSKPTNGNFEIEKWSTTNGGKSWTTLAITSGSAKHNARPILPHPVKGQHSTHHMLFWMNGDYIHYTNYATGIRYLSWEQPITQAPGVFTQPKLSRLDLGYQVNLSGSLAQSKNSDQIEYGWNLQGVKATPLTTDLATNLMIMRSSGK
jgi:hypothetical protein